MKAVEGYKKQELTKSGFLGGLFGGKPSGNAWKELENILAAADNAGQVDAATVKKVCKKWGAKLNEESNQQRSALYRVAAEAAYKKALQEDDAAFQEAAHLAEALDLPPVLVKMAERSAKTEAYRCRCRGLLAGTEPLDIAGINRLFAYDYEEGLAVRKQVFGEYFNELFNEMSKVRRFSPAEEETLREKCRLLDIPFEFRSNIQNALDHFRELWCAENEELGVMDVVLSLREGEVCRCYVNAGACQRKTVEREDNLLEVTRRFAIDETVTFAGEKLQHPKLQEEAVVVVSLGFFFLTDQRLLYITDKTAVTTELDAVTGADFDGGTVITFHTDEGDVIYKFADESADVLYILFNRVAAQRKEKKLKEKAADKK